MAFTVPFDCRPLFIGNKSITHKQFVANGLYNSYDYTDNVSVRTLRTSEVIRSNGTYLMGDRRFNFSTSLVTVAPQIRDVFVYDGDSYTVISVNKGELHDQIKTVARNVKLAYHLTDLVNIIRRLKLEETDEAGRSLFRTEIVALNVVCKVQLMDMVNGSSFGVDQLQKTYEIPIQDYPNGDELDIDCCVQLQDGRELEVTDIRDVDQLALLPVLVCEDNGARWQ